MADSGGLDWPGCMLTLPGGGTEIGADGAFGSGGGCITGGESVAGAGGVSGGGVGGIAVGCAAANGGIVFVADGADGTCDADGCGMLWNKGVDGAMPQQLDCARAGAAANARAAPLQTERFTKCANPGKVAECSPRNIRKMLLYEL